MTDDRLDLARQIDNAFAGWLALRDDHLDAALAASDDAGLPQIQVSAAQGKQLMLLVRAIGARRVLEVGTLGGYSTIWLARGLPEEDASARVVTLELLDAHADVAQQNIDRSGLSQRVEIRRGAAIETLDAMLAQDPSEPFDFVFIDADKESTRAYLDRAIMMCRPGSMVVIDNAVRGGRVLAPKPDDASAVAMRTVLETIGGDDRIDCSVVQTLGDKGHDGYILGVVR